MTIAARSLTPLWWRPRAQALLMVQLLGLGVLLVYYGSAACVPFIACAELALSVIAFRKGLLALGLFNALYSAYLLISILCFFHYIDVYLLESLSEDQIFESGTALLLLAQIVFNYPLFAASQQSHGKNSHGGAPYDDIALGLLALAALFLALYGYELYGGFIEFLHTPYDPIFEGAAENDYKHVIISTAGVMNTSLFCCAMQRALQRRHRIRFAILALVLLFVQATFFVQGKREYLVEMIMAAGVLFLLRGSQSHSAKKVLGFIFIMIFGVGIGAVGFALRSNAIEGLGSLLQLAIGYEGQFTVATFLNVVFAHHHFEVAYDYLQDLYRILLIAIPRDLFSLFAVDKDSFMPVSHLAGIYVENKGGQFVFTSAYAAGGPIGVLLYAFVLGRIFLLIDSALIKRHPWVYAVSISYLWVLIRKDFVLAFKYYFTGIITIALIFFIARIALKHFFEVASKPLVNPS
jgi:hypothetical protein